MVNIANATGYITEIVNDTDKEIIIKINQGLKNNVSVVSSISLDTKDPIQPKFSHDIVLPKRSCNSVYGLAMPIINANLFRGNLLDGQKYHYSVNLEFGGTCYSNEVAPGPFAGFRQIGNLFELISCQGIGSVNIFGDEFVQPFPVSIVTNEEVKDGASYAIEIIQKKPILYYNEVLSNGYTKFYTENSGPRQRRLVPDTVEIKINRPIESTQNLLATRESKAYISAFGCGLTPHGYVGVRIKFDQIVSNTYLDNFCKFIMQNPFMKKNGKLSTYYSENQSSVVICFKIYSKITEEEFQKLIDKANYYFDAKTKCTEACNYRS